MEPFTDMTPLDDYEHHIILPPSFPPLDIASEIRKSEEIDKLIQSTSTRSPVPVRLALFGEDYAINQFYDILSSDKQIKPYLSRNEAKRILKNNAIKTARVVLHHLKSGGDTPSSIPEYDLAEILSEINLLNEEIRAVDRKTYGNFFPDGGSNTQFLIENLPLIVEEKYVPSNQHIFRATQRYIGGIFKETWFKISEVEFQVLSVDSEMRNNCHYNWIGYIDDASAVLFVVDLSAYCVITNGENGVLRIISEIRKIYQFPEFSGKTFQIFLLKSQQLGDLLEKFPAENYFPKLREFVSLEEVDGVKRLCLFVEEMLTEVFGGEKMYVNVVVANEPSRITETLKDLVITNALDDKGFV